MPPPLSPIFNGCRQAGTRKLPISPLVGEMSGRTEGGAVPPSKKSLANNTIRPAPPNMIQVRRRRNDPPRHLHDHRRCRALYAAAARRDHISLSGA
ncbi:MAG: hypothetical protein EOQ86_28495 [Mesorhizobium sp.]|nr:MAG: hypothetical protein EOQ85_26635 [Mesorhizobium sp.]RWH77182.1 MAG: hypothetical protein EOQ86_28495 [Mesorhizobium sp.]RWH81621.1 MAG: hypothetical protein EOQ87_34585 [Mesorhizobium sp.]RWH92409.1 MAG: hypothetical protein EOQ88_29630 [Mesorhizobium sp.]RWH97161.1 MAG: hypothetical protein EOQ89_27415 [Mesorhizobium sp.]